MTFIHASHRIMSLTNLINLANTALILPDRYGKDDTQAKIPKVNVGKWVNVASGTFRIALEQT